VGGGSGGFAAAPELLMTAPKIDGVRRGSYGRGMRPAQGPGVSVDDSP
jgi:hypothetical protein